MLLVYFKFHNMPQGFIFGRPSMIPCTMLPNPGYGMHAIVAKIRHHVEQSATRRRRDRQQDCWKGYAASEMGTTRCQIDLYSSTRAFAGHQLLPPDPLSIQQHTVRTCAIQWPC
jgi:hypothetical protein